MDKPLRVTRIVKKYNMLENAHSLARRYSKAEYQHYRVYQAEGRYEYYIAPSSMPVAKEWVLIEEVFAPIKQ